MSNKIQQQQIYGLENVAPDIAQISGDLLATGASLTTALNTTGATLTSADTTLTNNLGTTGYNLKLLVGIVSGDLENTGSAVHTSLNTLTNNLGTTGTTLVAADSALSVRIDGSGDQLSTLITTNTSNLVTTGGNLQSELRNSGAYLQIQIWNSGDALSDSIAASGNNLQNQIWQSGFNFSTDLDATGTNLLVDTASTGDYLFNQFTQTGQSVSGSLDATGTSLIGNIWSTGSDLKSKLGYNSNGASVLASGVPTQQWGEVTLGGGGDGSTRVRVFNWNGTGWSGNHANGVELFLGGESSQRPIIPEDSTWFVKMYGVAVDMTFGGIGGELATNGYRSVLAFESGFIIDREGPNNAVKEMTLNGEINRVNDATYPWDIVPFIQGGYKLGITGYMGSLNDVKFAVTAVITETHNYLT